MPSLNRIDKHKNHKKIKRLILRFMDINEPSMRPWLSKEAYEQKIVEYEEKLQEYKRLLRERDLRQMRTEVELRVINETRDADFRRSPFLYGKYPDLKRNIL